MYSLTASVNLPLFFKSKQEPALQEARAALRQAKHELDATTAMTAAAVRDNYAMVQSAEKLMALYRDGLIPKSRQDFDLSLSGYGTGGSDAIAPLTKLQEPARLRVSVLGAVRRAGKGDRETQGDCWGRVNQIVNSEQ